MQKMKMTRALIVRTLETWQETVPCCRAVDNSIIRRAARTGGDGLNSARLVRLAIVEGLTRLPERDRLLIEARFMQGQTKAEAQQQVGLFGRGFARATAGAVTALYQLLNGGRCDGWLALLSKVNGGQMPAGASGKN